jgi:hypothetical protein
VLSDVLLLVMNVAGEFHQALQLAGPFRNSHLVRRLQICLQMSMKKWRESSKLTSSRTKNRGHLAGLVSSISKLKLSRTPSRRRHREVSNTLRLWSTIKQSLEQLPAFVRQQLPFVAAAWGSIDIQLRTMLKLFATAGVGFAAMVKVLKELQNTQYYQRMSVGVLRLCCPPRQRF